MKKLFLASLLFFLLFLKSEVVVAKEATASAAPVRVEYELPYPGLLPDNPLYFLKAIRDNLQKFFISDPLRKAEFDLLQANKRLKAGEILIMKGKFDLGFTTLSKAGNYFEDGLVKVQLAKKQGNDVNSLLSEMFTAAKKQQEVMQNLEKNKKGDELRNLRFLEERARDFSERVLIIKS